MSTKDRGGPKIFKLAQPLNFKDSKYTLYECDKEHKQGKTYYYSVRAINVFCWLNLMKNVYRFRIFRTILWGIPTLISHTAYRGFREHCNSLVTKIELKDDGT